MGQLQSHQARNGAIDGPGPGIATKAQGSSTTGPAGRAEVQRHAQAARAQAVIVTSNRPAQVARTRAAPIPPVEAQAATARDDAVRT